MMTPGAEFTMPEPPQMPTQDPKERLATLEQLKAAGPSTRPSTPPSAGRSSTRSEIHDLGIGTPAPLHPR
jgi:hypothetical protein